MRCFRLTDTTMIIAKKGEQIPNVQNTSRWFRMSELMIRLAFRRRIGSALVPYMSVLSLQLSFVLSPLFQCSGQNKPFNTRRRDFGKLVYLLEVKTQTKKMGNKTWKECIRIYTGMNLVSRTEEQRLL